MSAEDMMEVVSDVPHILEAVMGAVIKDKYLERLRLVKDCAKPTGKEQSDFFVHIDFFERERERENKRKRGRGKEK